MASGPSSMPTALADVLARTSEGRHKTRRRSWPAQAYRFDRRRREGVGRCGNESDDGSNAAAVAVSGSGGVAHLHHEGGRLDHEHVGCVAGCAEELAVGGGGDAVQ